MGFSKRFWAINELFLTAFSGFGSLGVNGLSSLSQGCLIELRNEGRGGKTGLRVRISQPVSKEAAEWHEKTLLETWEISWDCGDDSREALVYLRGSFSLLNC